MTQALNLANFANNLNTSGATSNAGLQNSSVTVTAGTGLSGGGAVSLGGSVSLANAGVTSVAAGSGISVSGSTGAVTISASGGASGTVTSVATGNGLSGGTITTSGTLTVACPSANSIGSYAAVYVGSLSGGIAVNFGSNYSAANRNGSATPTIWLNPVGSTQGLISGTWKYLGYSGTGGCCGTVFSGVACRVS